MKAADHQKQEIRKRYLALRKNLSREQRVDFSEKMAERIKEWPLYRKAETIHCFLSIEENAEVITRPLLKLFSEDRKRIVVPRIVEGTGEMEHIEFRLGDNLSINRWGVPEPTQGDKVPPGQLDLILVPAIAADLEKNRIGYGKGYYDRFLAKTDGIKTGLIFEISLSSKPLPAEEFDVKLDYLITEKKIY